MTQVQLDAPEALPADAPAVFARDGVLLLPGHDRPGRGIETCKTGQRRVVVVDRAARGQRQHFSRRDGMVDYAEQVIELAWRKAGIRLFRDRDPRNTG